jgi:GNAT superfamily N-acetyltransferase
MIRGPRSSDQAFIASTWVRSMSGVGGRKLGRDGGLVAKRIDDVFDRGDTRALVRHAAGDQDRIMGWVVYVDGPGVPVIHYTYVRKEHRGKGVAAELLTAAACRRDKALVYTCEGPDTRKLITAYPLATHLPLAEFLNPS